MKILVEMYIKIITDFSPPLERLDLWRLTQSEFDGDRILTPTVPCVIRLNILRYLDFREVPTWFKTDKGTDALCTIIKDQ